jgi:electron transfer flavoprotein beta subunit
MRIVVCVKHVAVLGDEVEFTPDERRVDQDFLDHTLNEWDACATEEALRIRERLGGDVEVVAVTVGDRTADEALRRCLAMGADRAVRVAVDGEPVLDPIALARMLADAIEREDPDLVFTGVQSSDSVQGSTGTALAEFLRLPGVAVVKKVDYDPAAHTALVHRELEGGLVDVVEVDTPALLSIQTGTNEPRYVTFRAIKDAERTDIELIAGDPTRAWGYQVRRMFVPPKPEGSVMLEGTPAEVARRIAEIVKDRLA